MIPLIVTIVALGAVTWAVYLGMRQLGPHLPALLAAWRGRFQRIVEDPLDYVRRWVARVSPSRVRLEQRTGLAQLALDRADGREERLLTGFKDGSEPTHRSTIIAMVMFIVWLVAITAAALIDLPIVQAVSGGNLLMAILGTALVLGVPILGSIGLGELVMRRRDQMSALPFSLAVAGILTAFAAVVAMLMYLAPIRAEIEYEDAIRTAKQQIVAYTEDGDTNALAFVEVELEALEKQQAISADWNTALVPIAAGVEFASGFFMPVAVPIIQLVGARATKRKAQNDVRAAQNRSVRLQTRQYRQLSRVFARAGVSQGDLQRHLTTVIAENGAGREVAAPEPVTEPRNIPPVESDPPSPPTVPDLADPDLPDLPDLPDPSFDQS